MPFNKFVASGHVPFFTKKELSLSCKASRRALTTWVYHASRGLTSGCDSAVQLEKSAGTEYDRILTTNIFLSTGRCDRTGNEWAAGSLQQEYLHSWQQLANDDVVLAQLGVGVDVRLLHGGGAVELPVVAVY